MAFTLSLTRCRARRHPHLAQTLALALTLTVPRRRSEQCLEAVRVELVHALARDVRRHPLVRDEPARRRLNIEGHHVLRVEQISRSLREVK